MSRRRLLIVSIAAAAALAGGLVAALVLTSGGSGKPSASLVGAERVATMLRGIPQSGEELGSPSAPVTLVEFADPQCPYCAEWAKRAFPTIVQRYVRTGKVRVVFNGMTFVGPESDTALRTALAAGRQNRFWNVLELLFENQGTENAGWVTEPLLRSVGSAAGVDVERMLSERASTTVEQALTRAASLAQTAGVDSTPTFAVGRTGGTLQIVRIGSLEPSGLTPSLDAALGE